MEFFFWGLEVKPGESVKVSPAGDNFQLHLSQAAFGEVEEDHKVTMFVKVDDRQLSIGTLSTDKFPQIMLDLVFNQEFELSHTSKSSCVFFTGYNVSQQAEEEPNDKEERGRKNAPAPKQNCIQTKEEPKGKAEEKEKKPEQVKAETESETDEDSDDESYSTLVPIPDHELCSYTSEEDDAEEEGLPKELSEVDDSSEEDVEEEEILPKKSETGKKRAAVIPLKAPASDKKAKVAALSGQNIGDKKWAKSHKPLSPLACKCCPKRIFKNEYALECHTKAKHNAVAK